MRMAMSGLTVCVTGGGVGVDNFWEQEKFDGKKLPENTQTPTTLVHALLGRCQIAALRILSMFRFDNLAINGYPIL
jgi:hypothetical protein